MRMMALRTPCSMREAFSIRHSEQTNLASISKSKSRVERVTILSITHHVPFSTTMKQGSILSYLKRTTAAPNSEDQATENQPSIVLRVIASEETAIDDAGSQEIKADSILEADDTTNGSREATVLSMNLHDPRASITKVFPSHIDRLKSITSTLLPVRYSDRFFAECLDFDNHNVLSYTSLFDSKPVGWIRCRLEPFPNLEKPEYQQIYIQALGVLAPYRGMGLATALLNAVVSDQSDSRSMYAHVWEDNEDALEWYDKRGFRRVLLVPQYYRRLTPSGAWIVRRDVP